MRKLVTNLDGTVLIENIPTTVEYEDGHKITELWVTKTKTPNLDDSYISNKKFSLDLEPGHTRFVSCEIPPLRNIISKENLLDIKNFGKHSTLTIDYIVVLEGEVDLIISGKSYNLKAGDFVIQRGTIHSWHNNGDKNCKILAVMIGANNHEKFKNYNFVQKEL